MKNKLLFAIGIIIMIAGIGIFIYPVVTQAISAHEQKVFMQEIKEQILLNIAEAEELNQAYEISGQTEDNINDDSSSDNTDSGISIPNVDVTSVLGEVTEEEVVEDKPVEKSKLAGQKSMGIVSIPKIGIVYAIIEGVDKNELAVGIGHFPKSVSIGAEGNCGLAGHSGGHLGKYFKDINKLEIGDEVILTDLKGSEYTYVVTESFICDPSDVYVVEDLGVPGKFVTMVTCTQNGTKRWIIRAQCTTQPVKMKGIK